MYKFSWGAFAFGWVYGLFNKSWLCFLSLLPAVLSTFAGIAVPGIVKFIIALYIGFNAQKWSAKSSIDAHSDRWYARQAAWNTFGLVWLILKVILAVLAFLLPGLGILGLLLLVL